MKAVLDEIKSAIGQIVTFIDEIDQFQRAVDRL